jgi:diaphanous 1
MKGIFWTSIHARTVDETVWKDIDDTDVDIDTNLLIEHFSKKKTQQKAESSESKSGPASPKAITIVDGKKQQNAGIVISRLKMDANELRSAVMNMDESLLTPDKVGMLINIAPTPEEIGALQAYDGDASLLGKVDKLLLELTMITHFKEQLQCMHVKYSFAEQARELERVLSTCSQAVVQMRESHKLKSLLKVILRVGNFMNGGSRRGGSFGVKLDVLDKIETSKSKSGKFTLVHYVVQSLQKVDAAALGLRGDLSASTEAAKYTLGQLHGDFAVLRKGMQMVKNEVAWANKSEAAPNFATLMGPFAAAAEKTVEDIENGLKTLKSDFEALVTSYGENAAKTELDAFFKQIDHFCQVFEQAIGRVEATAGGLKLGEE